MKVILFSIITIIALYIAISEHIRAFNYEQTFESYHNYQEAINRTRGQIDPAYKCKAIK